ncbi:signal peptide peptidase SppA [Methylovirgula sp. 4M-Z18]|nr:signal peptide peptidase SppA [Methylovirgula sp. 4M-Z18]RFB79084.1 signal peptide peptidase SppA [Methylovirgula sp. 4M-Z18]
MPGSYSAAPADYLIDRRRLRRKLTFWRLAAVAIVLLALIGLFARSIHAVQSPHIARININGVITGDDATAQLLKRAEDANVRAVILDIESPGGTTTGSEILYDQIRRVADKKPVVAVVGTMAASGAYIAALATDHIVAHQTSLVGSIGVLFEYPNVSKLLDTVGVQMETIKSSPLKASPNGFEPTSEAAKAALAALVTDSFDWFKALVKERRHMTDAELAAVADGRVFTGHLGLPLKLIDEIGGEREAIAWLEDKKGVTKGLSVETLKKPTEWKGLGLFGRAADWLGFSSLARVIDRSSERADASLLDGMVSIWQVSPNN